MLGMPVVVNAWHVRPRTRARTRTELVCPTSWRRWTGRHCVRAWAGMTTPLMLVERGMMVMVEVEVRMRLTDDLVVHSLVERRGRGRRGGCRHHARDVSVFMSLPLEWRTFEFEFALVSRLACRTRGTWLARTHGEVE